YEAARIDGAGRWQQSRYIVLPLLAPTSPTLILMSALWHHHALNQLYVTLRKDPGWAADVPPTPIHRERFTTFASRVGAAMSLALMAIMLIFTAIYLRAVRRGSSLAEG